MCAALGLQTVWIISIATGLIKQLRLHVQGIGKALPHGQPHMLQQSYRLCVQCLAHVCSQCIGESVSSGDKVAIKGLGELLNALQQNTH